MFTNKDAPKGILPLHGRHESRQRHQLAAVQHGQALAEGQRPVLLPQRLVGPLLRVYHQGSHLVLHTHFL